MKRVLRNSYLGLVPPRVICEVGDGGGWPTSQITRGGICMVYTVHTCTCIICFTRYILVSLGISLYLLVSHRASSYYRFLSVSLGMSTSGSLGISRHLIVPPRTICVSCYLSASLGISRYLIVPLRFLSVSLGTPPYLSASFGIGFSR